jgi:hypothetical protein
MFCQILINKHFSKLCFHRVSLIYEHCVSHFVIEMSQFGLTFFQTTEVLVTTPVRSCLGTFCFRKQLLPIRSFFLQKKKRKCLCAIWKSIDSLYVPIYYNTNRNIPGIISYIPIWGMISGSILNSYLSAIVWRWICTSMTLRAILSWYVLFAL